ncbi:DnaJ C-terminal domain-containing protein [Massilia varians]|uniref:DnaJ C-terminal domain-containing protein n=1 Tax=Massilia varians TaxID=457921 RepID=UPI00248F6617|nr:DnaJ C-terminal domain-containing protein [Massilia varians]
MEYKDYYKTLGLEKDASPEDIKKAYRKLVRQYHPDVSKHKDATEKTKEINEAYDVLGDADKRAAYDDLGRRGQQTSEGFRPPPDWGAQYDFSGAEADDLFADLFAHMGRRGRTGAGRGAGFQVRGEDIHAAITIDLRDAYTGATRNIGLRVPAQNAQGHVTMQEKTLSVNIPRGVTPGQRLRLAGQGQPGIGGGPAGDLYLEIQFKEDPRYRIEGANVYETAPVAPWEAALGARVSVPTPSGMVEVAVPAGSQTGRKLRLKGRGIPAATPGDLYLILEVVLPPATTSRAKELYEQMAREMSFNPRDNMGA